MDHGRMAMGKTSIIILSYNTYEYTKGCIESIRRYTEKSMYEIIVVDNASTDATVPWLKAQDDITCVFNADNQGFPKGCNQGLRIATGESLLLLNSDTLVMPHWLENLCHALYSTDAIGAVGCVTNNCSNFQQIPVNYTTRDELMAFASSYNQADAAKWELTLTLVGFCFLFKRKVYEQLGGLDEAFSPGNLEDDDYSLRIWKAGYKLLLCRDTFIHHFGSVSFAKDAAKKQQEEWRDALIAKNFCLLQKKWGVTETYKLCDNAKNYLPGSLAPNSRILLLDCGCGMDMFRLAAKYKDIALYGVTTNIREAAIVQYTGFHCAYCENLEMDLFRYLKESFDYIFLWRIFDKCTDRLRFVSNMQSYLRPQGRLHVWIRNYSCFMGKNDDIGNLISRIMQQDASLQQEAEHKGISCLLNEIE